VSKYPRIVENGRRPKAEFDGQKGYGKPCVICGTGTIGSKWVQVDYMRGDDEEIRVCSQHYKTPAADLITAWERME
jgi:hypothetical protein